MRRLLFASALSVLMPLAAAPALAQDEKSPETLALEGLDRMMRALELFVDTLPMYEAPEVLPNGDIVIRRIQPEDGRKPKKDDEGEVHDT